MANSSLNLVSLDFDTMKSELKTYLKSQPQFMDYDFEGSNLSVLLDILSYNTFHNAFYLNMIMSESFLDSAQRKNSIISHAKELNYVPRSARSAKATVNLNFSTNNSIVTIPKGTSFTSMVGSKLYTFCTDTETVHFSSNGTFSINNLELYEGSYTEEQYTINYENPVQRFLINDPNSDTRSISVTVIEDNDGTVYNYNLATTTLDLKNTSNIYFLQAAEDNKYEIIFGDNIIGRKPKDNSLIKINYRVNTNLEGNGASRFTLDNGFTTFTTSPTVTTVDIARGGALPEDINSIRFYAPRYFQVQERAINTSDYEILLKQKFPEIQSISAYGGEEINPPQYGRVFISVDLADIEGLPTSKINEYYQFLKPRSPLSLDPFFISPEYLYYSVNSNVKYNFNNTDLNSEQIQSLIVNKIINYNDENLTGFKSSFKYSKFISQIDNIENASIISNDTDIKIYKKISPLFAITQNLVVNFDIPLTQLGGRLSNVYNSNDLTAISSTSFNLNGEKVHIDDDGNGIIRVVKKIGDQHIVVQSNVGTINYETGTLNFINFKVDSLNPGENHIKVFAVPESKDFSTSKNVILNLENTQINVTVIPVRENLSNPTTIR
jgi:hypothetical protein